MFDPHNNASDPPSNSFDAENKRQASMDCGFEDYTAGPWTDISEVLRAIPVQPSALHESVMPLLEASQQAETGHSPRHDRPVSGNSRRLAAVASLAALLVAGFLTSAPVDRSSQEAENAGQVATGSEFLEGVRRTNQSEWQVVVVNVPEDDCARVRGKITESVVSKGLAVESVDSGGQIVALDSPDVFISTGDTAAEVLRALETEIQMSAGEVTAGLPEEFDRDELLSRFRESMESPTESDRYFGEILVIHPDAGSVRVFAEPISEAIVKNESGGMRNPASGSPSTADGATSPFSDNGEKQRPVLVVLVRKKAAAAGPQSRSHDRRDCDQTAAHLITG